MPYPCVTGPGSRSPDTFALIHGHAPRFDLGLLELMFTCVLSLALALTWNKKLATGIVHRRRGPRVRARAVRDGLPAHHVAEDPRNADLRYGFGASVNPGPVGVRRSFRLRGRDALLRPLAQARGGADGPGDGPADCPRAGARQSARSCGALSTATQARCGVRTRPHVVGDRDRLQRVEIARPRTRGGWSRHARRRSARDARSGTCTNVADALHGGLDARDVAVAKGLLEVALDVHRGEAHARSRMSAT